MLNNVLVTESLRKYPPVPHLIREVTEDYTVDEYKCVLKKGTLLHVPVYAIHHDNTLYDNVRFFISFNLSISYLLYLL